MESTPSHTNDLICFPGSRLDSLLYRPLMPIAFLTKGYRARTGPFSCGSPPAHPLERERHLVRYMFRLNNRLMLKSKQENENIQLYSLLVSSMVQSYMLTRPPSLTTYSKGCPTRLHQAHRYDTFASSSGCYIDLLLWFSAPACRPPKVSPTKCKIVHECNIC